MRLQNDSAYNESFNFTMMTSTHIFKPNTDCISSCHYTGLAVKLCNVICLCQMSFFTRADDAWQKAPCHTEVCVIPVGTQFRRWFSFFNSDPSHSESSRSQRLAERSLLLVQPPSSDALSPKTVMTEPSSSSR
jgi:hypothetical protein